MEVAVVEKQPLKEQRRNLFMVDPRTVIADEEFNIRKDYGDITKLKESIIVNGVKVPLRGYKDGDTWVITDGFRRLRAVSAALAEGVDIGRIPFVTEPKGYTKQDRMLDMFILNDGKRLTPIEEGILFKKLEVYGYTRKEISLKTGRPESHISNMIALGNQTELTKALVAKGEISASTVVKLMRVNKNAPEKVQKSVSTAVDMAKSAGRVRAVGSKIKETQDSQMFNSLVDLLKELKSTNNSKVDTLKFLVDNINKAPMKAVLKYFKSK